MFVIFEKIANKLSPVNEGEILHITIFVIIFWVKNNLTMDRTMYGKFDPGARQPYRCTLRDKGILPGCKSYCKNIFVLSYHVSPIFDLIYSDDNIKFYSYNAYIH